MSAPKNYTTKILTKRGANSPARSSAEGNIMNKAKVLIGHPARGNCLRPGRKYNYHTSFGVDTHVIEFVRRIPYQPGRAAINQFLVPAFAGLNGPTDKGLTEFSDRDVRKLITIIPVETAR